MYACVSKRAPMCLRVDSDAVSLPQFGDDGLLLITEHLHKLEELNLCETYVTNKSLPSLAGEFPT